MSTAEAIVKDIQDIEAACEEMAANSDKMNVHDAAKIATLRNKATEYLAHFRRNIKTWPEEQ